jgi:hypothetical protein
MKPSIWRSRKFWIAVVDAFGGLLALYAGALLLPDKAELIVATYAFIQIPVGVLINSIAKEDAAAMQSGYAEKPPPPGNLPK